MDRLSWEKFVEVYDNYSLKHFLRQKARLSYGAAIQAIGVFENFESFMDNSIIEIAVDYCYSGTRKRIKGGFDLLPKTLAKIFSSDELMLNKKVYEIHHDKNGVIVKYVTN